MAKIKKTREKVRSKRIEAVSHLLLSRLLLRQRKRRLAAQNAILKKQRIDPFRVSGPTGVNKSNISAPILEKGIFYFFLRPRVNTVEVHSLSDVQKSYLLLRPTSKDLSSGPSKLRIIQIPKKALPATGTHERFLAFVIQSEESIKDLKDDIGESTYSTATRGERVQPAARPVAEGVYAIIGDEDGRTTHFAYLLTLPAHATVHHPFPKHTVGNGMANGGVGGAEGIWIE